MKFKSFFLYFRKKFSIDELTKESILMKLEEKAGSYVLDKI